MYVSFQTCCHGYVFPKKVQSDNAKGQRANYIGRQRCPYVQIFILFFSCLSCFFPQFYIDPEIQFKWKSKRDKGEECWPFFEGLVKNI